MPSSLLWNCLWKKPASYDTFGVIVTIVVIAVVAAAVAAIVKDEDKDADLVNVIKSMLPVEDEQKASIRYSKNDLYL
jgi:hypothetical protein